MAFKKHTFEVSGMLSLGSQTLAVNGQGVFYSLTPDQNIIQIAWRILLITESRQGLELDKRHFIESKSPKGVTNADLFWASGDKNIGGNTLGSKFCFLYSFISSFTH